MPHRLTPPATSLWDNLEISARRYRDRPALIFFGIWWFLMKRMGLLNTLFDGWEPYKGPMLRRPNGALVSVEAQSVRAFADRATLERAAAELTTLGQREATLRRGLRDAGVHGCEVDDRLRRVHRADRVAEEWNEKYNEATKAMPAIESAYAMVATSLALAYEAFV